MTIGKAHIYLPRINTALRILREMKINASTYLDIGCANGEITMEVANIIGAKEVYGIDINREALKEAEKRGIKVFMLDISKDKLPFKDNSIDLITAFEIIEHLINPDHMLREAYRVLRKGGYLLLSTPNLASWANRIAMLLGYQPYNVETSTEILAGVLIRWKGLKPIGHIRSYTLRALKELLLYHGFWIIKIKGTYDVVPRWLIPIDKLLSIKSSFARRLIILAMKGKNT